jgi:hypothetical protein
MTKSESGRLGGLSTLQKHGKKHFSVIGKKGAEVFHIKYFLFPVDLNKFAIINRITGEFIRIRNS